MEKCAESKKERRSSVCLYSSKLSQLAENLLFFLSNNHANASTEDRVKVKLHFDRLAAAVQPSHGTTTGEKSRRKGSFARLQSPLRRSLPAGVPQRWLQTQGARPGWGLWKHSLQLLSCGTITRDSLEMFNLALPAWKTHFPTSATGRVFARRTGGRGLLARDARQAFFPGRLAAKCHLPVPSAHPEARDSAAFYILTVTGTCVLRPGRFTS